MAERNLRTRLLMAACYLPIPVLNLIPSVALLMSKKDDSHLQYHAKQGLAVCGFFLLLQIVGVLGVFAVMLVSINSAFFDPSPVTNATAGQIANSIDATPHAIGLWVMASWVFSILEAILMVLVLSGADVRLPFVSKRIEHTR